VDTSERVSEATCLLIKDYRHQHKREVLSKS